MLWYTCFKLISIEMNLKNKEIVYISSLLTMTFKVDLKAFSALSVKYLVNTSDIKLVSVRSEFEWY